MVQLVLAAAAVAAVVTEYLPILHIMEVVVAVALDCLVKVLMVPQALTILAEVAVLVAVLAAQVVIIPTAARAALMVAAVAVVRKVILAAMAQAVQSESSGPARLAHSQAQIQVIYE